MAKGSILIKWVNGLYFHDVELIYDIKQAAQLAHLSAGLG